MLLSFRVQCQFVSVCLLRVRRLLLFLLLHSFSLATGAAVARAPLLRRVAAGDLAGLGALLLLLLGPKAGLEAPELRNGAGDDGGLLHETEGELDLGGG